MICTQFSGHWMDNTSVSLKTGSVLFTVDGNAAGARPGGTRRSAEALQYPIHPAACVIKQGTVAQKTLQQSLRALCGVFGSRQHKYGIIKPKAAHPVKEEENEQKGKARNAHPF